MMSYECQRYSAVVMLVQLCPSHLSTGITLANYYFPLRMIHISVY